MNDLIEHQPSQVRRILINLSCGNAYNQNIDVDSDNFQNFIDWYRNPKGGEIWTWRCPAEQAQQMFQRSHITSVDIQGYIEPWGESKWYQRIMDKIRTAWLLRR